MEYTLIQGVHSYSQSTLLFMKYTHIHGVHSYSWRTIIFSFNHGVHYYSQSSLLILEYTHIYEAPSILFMELVHSILFMEYTLIYGVYFHSWNYTLIHEVHSYLQSTPSYTRSFSWSKYTRSYGWSILSLMGYILIYRVYSYSWKYTLMVFTTVFLFSIF